MWTGVFWDVLPCCMEKSYRCFEQTYSYVADKDANGIIIIIQKNTRVASHKQQHEYTVSSFIEMVPNLICFIYTGVLLSP